MHKINVIFCHTFKLKTTSFGLVPVVTKSAALALIKVSASGVAISSGSQSSLSNTNVLGWKRGENKIF